MTLHDEHHLRRQRQLVWLGLGTAIVLGTAAQLLWKSAALAAPPSGAPLEVLKQIMSRWQFVVAIALYILQFFNWMAVLKHADLSYAQPITAASYLTVGAAAWWLFGETLPPHRMLGIGLILLGVYFITRTPHRSSLPAPVVMQTGEHS